MTEELLLITRITDTVMSRVSVLVINRYPAR